MVTTPSPLLSGLPAAHTDNLPVSSPGSAQQVFSRFLQCLTQGGTWSLQSCTFCHDNAHDDSHQLSSWPSTADAFLQPLEWYYCYVHSLRSCMASVKYLNFSGPELPDISNEEAKHDPRHLCDLNFWLSCAQDNTFLRPCHHWSSRGVVTVRSQGHGAAWSYTGL